MPVLFSLLDAVLGCMGESSGTQRHGCSFVLILQWLRKMPHWYFCCFVSVCDRFTLQTNPSCVLCSKLSS